jgi:hypothetical protein
MGKFNTEIFDPMMAGHVMHCISTNPFYTIVAGCAIAHKRKKEITSCKSTEKLHHAKQFDMLHSARQAGLSSS